MSFKSVFAALLFFGAIACKSKSVYQYSEKIVALERSLIPDIEKTESDIERYVYAAKFDSVAVAGERMEEMIDAKLQEIKKMPAPDAEEAENFKKAAVRYFDFLKSIYVGYKRYGMQTTDEGRNIEIDKLMALVQKKDKAIADMQEAQRKYAEANGFKVNQK